MSRRIQDGFENLARAAADEIAIEISLQKEQVPGDSVIERLFCVALHQYVRIATPFGGITFVTEDELSDVLATKTARIFLVIQPQAQFEWGRVDFLIHASRGVDADKNTKWRRLIVECDGHDFHERTKDQAARDRSRDRSAQMDGIPVFRFTGSELWRDAWGCAKQVADWAWKGVE